jgi:hypothetical protein
MPEQASLLTASVSSQHVNAVRSLLSASVLGEPSVSPSRVSTCDAYEAEAHAICLCLVCVLPLWHMALSS